MTTICEDLRKAVLQAAIQGRLTQQLPEDGNAEDLYKEIQKEKQRLIKEGKIKREKPLPEITEEEIPFDIPENWKWVRLNEIGLSFADGPFGSNLKREHYTENPEVRIVQLSNIGEDGWVNANVKYTTYEHLETISRSEVNAGDIVIAKMMPAGRAIIIPDLGTKFVLSSDAVKVVPSSCIDINYLLNVINSSVFKSQVYSEVQGITRVRTSLGKLRTYLVPLPPLAEQKRIVAKVDELMAKVAELKRTEEDIKALYEVFPGDMKASLLQAAIQGRLIEQLPEDGNVEDLYNEIQTEKARLIKEGKLKKEKPLPEITEDEIPFDIPENWKWVRLGNVSDIARGGSPRPIKEFITDTPDGINWIKIGDTEKDGKYINSCKEKIKPSGISKSRLVYPGDFLLTNSMSYGRPYITQIKGCIHDGWLVISGYQKLYSQDFLYYILSSDFAYIQFCGVVSGAVVKNLNIDKVRESIFPLPPLAEQKRIVEKLDQLLPLCDAINAEISGGKRA